MPLTHTSHTGPSRDDLGSTDEVKVFKDEGDREDETISSENLLEEKSSLIDLTESEEKSVKSSSRHDHGPLYGKLEPHGNPGAFNMGYLMSPYSYGKGSASALPVSMASKMGLSHFFGHSGDHLTSPPPAHCGIPPYQLDPKGLTRPSLYSFPTSQYHYPMLSPEMSQVAASWHTPTIYSTLQINTTLPSDFYRFSPTPLLPSVHSHHSLTSHPAIVTPGPKQEVGQDTCNRYGRRLMDPGSSSSSSMPPDSKDNICSDNKKKQPHIKKPLNAFMLYMKEMRAKVVAECTLKESAAINQILGRKWHSLSRDEQSVYYDKARQERQLHMELYPGWSARNNYGYGSKKKKRKKDRLPSDSSGNNMKKCRAKYGLDQQNQWCKPCRRKKKCIRYKESDIDDGHHVSDDNLGSCGSIDEAPTPEDDSESLNHSLQSPATSLASPLNMLGSPATPTGFYHHHDHLHSVGINSTAIIPNGSVDNNNVNNSISTNSESSNYNLDNNDVDNDNENLIEQNQNSGSNNNNNNMNNNNNNNNSNSNNSNSSNNNNNNNNSNNGHLNNESTNDSSDNFSCNNNNNNNNNTHSNNLSSMSMCPSSPASGLRMGAYRFPKLHSIQPPAAFRSQKLSLASPTSTCYSSTKQDPSVTNKMQIPQSDSILISTKALQLDGFNSQISHLPYMDSIFDKSLSSVVKNPVGANPRDINNPLSINQLTKQCHQAAHEKQYYQQYLHRLQQHNLQQQPNFHQTHSLHAINHNSALPQLLNFANASVSAATGVAVAAAVVAVSPSSTSSQSASIIPRQSTNVSPNNTKNKSRTIGVDDDAISVL